MESRGGGDAVIRIIGTLDGDFLLAAEVLVQEELRLVGMTPSLAGELVHLAGV